MVKKFEVIEGNAATIASTLLSRKQSAKNGKLLIHGIACQYGTNDSYGVLIEYDDGT